MGKKQRNRVTRQKSGSSLSKTSMSNAESPNGEVSDGVPPISMTNANEVHAFMQKCEQFRFKIADFEVISRPLYELLEEDKSFVWSPSCNIAYEHLATAIGKLTLSPIISSGGDGIPKSFSTPKTHIENPKTMSEGTAGNILHAIDNLTHAIGKMQTKNENHKPKPFRYSESSSDSEPEDLVSVPSTSQIRRAQSHMRNVKLPPFTGKETWKVWFNRFEEVAERKGWDDNDKLDELLPKLQGVAGDFVFGQLSKKSRGSYITLVKELKTRFRVIENPKAFGVKFSRRDQKNGETVEEYAAALKELYDKAHPERDEQTREEDLLRRFLDGLLDEKAKVQVEFVKAPYSIDEAVYEVVNFCETQNRVYGEKNRKSTRMVRPDESDDSDDDENMVHPVNRVHLKPAKEQGSEAQSQIEILAKQVTELSEKFENSTKKFRTNRKFEGKCYNCGIQGHSAKFCRKPARPKYDPMSFPPTNDSAQVLNAQVPVHHYAPPTHQYVPMSQTPDQMPNAGVQSSLSANAPTYDTNALNQVGPL